LAQGVKVRDIQLIPYPFSCEEKGVRTILAISPSLGEERGWG
jgi:hypothetical protein